MAQPIITSPYLRRQIEEAGYDWRDPEVASRLAATGMYIGRQPETGFFGGDVPAALGGFARSVVNTIGGTLDIPLAITRFFGAPDSFRVPEWKPSAVEMANPIASGVGGFTGMLPSFILGTGAVATLPGKVGRGLRVLRQAEKVADRLGPVEAARFMQGGNAFRSGVLLSRAERTVPESVGLFHGLNRYSMASRGAHVGLTMGMLGAAQPGDIEDKLANAARGLVEGALFGSIAASPLQSRGQAILREAVGGAIGPPPIDVEGLPRPVGGALFGGLLGGLFQFPETRALRQTRHKPEVVIEGKEATPEYLAEVAQRLGGPALSKQDVHLILAEFRGMSERSQAEVRAALSDVGVDIDALNRTDLGTAPPRTTEENPTIGILDDRGQISVVEDISPGPRIGGIPEVEPAALAELTQVAAQAQGEVVGRPIDVTRGKVLIRHIETEEPSLLDSVLIEAQEGVGNRASDADVSMVTSALVDVTSSLPAGLFRWRFQDVPSDTVINLVRAPSRSIATYRTEPGGGRTVTISVPALVQARAATGESLQDTLRYMLLHEMTHGAFDLARFSEMDVARILGAKPLDVLQMTRVRDGLYELGGEYYVPLHAVPTVQTAQVVRQGGIHGAYGYLPVTRDFAEKLFDTRYGYAIRDTRYPNMTELFAVASEQFLHTPLSFIQNNPEMVQIMEHLYRDAFGVGLQDILRVHRDGQARSVKIRVIEEGPRRGVGINTPKPPDGYDEQRFFKRDGTTFTLLAKDGRWFIKHGDAMEDIPTHGDAVRIYRESFHNQVAYHVDHFVRKQTGRWDVAERASGEMVDPAQVDAFLDHLQQSYARDPESVPQWYKEAMGQVVSTPHKMPVPAPHIVGRTFMQWRVNSLAEATDFVPAALRAKGINEYPLQEKHIKFAFEKMRKYGYSVAQQLEANGTEPSFENVFRAMMSLRSKDPRHISIPKEVGGNELGDYIVQVERWMARSHRPEEVEVPEQLADTLTLRDEVGREVLPNLEAMVIEQTNKRLAAQPPESFAASMVLRVLEGQTDWPTLVEGLRKAGYPAMDDVAKLKQVFERVEKNALKRLAEHLKEGGFDDVPGLTRLIKSMEGDSVEDLLGFIEAQSARLVGDDLPAKSVDAIQRKIMAATYVLNQRRAELPQVEPGPRKVLPEAAQTEMAEIEARKAEIEEGAPTSAEEIAQIKAETDAVNRPIDDAPARVAEDTDTTLLRSWSEGEQPAPRAPEAPAAPKPAADQPFTPEELAELTTLFDVVTRFADARGARKQQAVVNALERIQTVLGDRTLPESLGGPRDAPVEPGQPIKPKPTSQASQQLKAAADAERAEAKKALKQKLKESRKITDKTSADYALWEARVAKAREKLTSLLETAQSTMAKAEEVRAQSFRAAALRGKKGRERLAREADTLRQEALAKLQKATENYEKLLRDRADKLAPSIIEADESLDSVMSLFDDIFYDRIGAINPAPARQLAHQMTYIQAMSQLGKPQIDDLYWLLDPRAQARHTALRLMDSHRIDQNNAAMNRARMSILRRFWRGIQLHGRKGREGEEEWGAVNYPVLSKLMGGKTYQNLNPATLMKEFNRISEKDFGGRFRIEQRPVVGQPHYRYLVDNVTGETYKMPNDASAVFLANLLWLDNEGVGLMLAETPILGLNEPPRKPRPGEFDGEDIKPPRSRPEVKRGYIEMSGPLTWWKRLIKPARRVISEIETQYRKEFGKDLGLLALYDESMMGYVRTRRDVARYSSLVNSIMQRHGINPSKVREMELLHRIAAARTERLFRVQTQTEDGKWRALEEGVYVSGQNELVARSLELGREEALLRLPEVEAEIVREFNLPKEEAERYMRFIHDMDRYIYEPAFKELGLDTRRQLVAYYSLFESATGALGADKQRLVDPLGRIHEIFLFKDRIKNKEQEDRVTAFNKQFLAEIGVNHGDYLNQTLTYLNTAMRAKNMTNSIADLQTLITDLDGVTGRNINDYLRDIVRRFQGQADDAQARGQKVRAERLANNVRRMKATVDTLSNWNALPERAQEGLVNFYQRMGIKATRGEVRSIFDAWTQSHRSMMFGFHLMRAIRDPITTDFFMVMPRFGLRVFGQAYKEIVFDPDKRAALLDRYQRVGHVSEDFVTAEMYAQETAFPGGGLFSKAEQAATGLYRHMDIHSRLVATRAAEIAFENAMVKFRKTGNILDFLELSALDTLNPNEAEPYLQAAKVALENGDDQKLKHLVMQAHQDAAVFNYLRPAAAGYRETVSGRFFMQYGSWALNAIHQLPWLIYGPIHQHARLEPMRAVRRTATIAAQYALAAQAVYMLGAAFGTDTSDFIPWVHNLWYEGGPGLTLTRRVADMLSGDPITVRRLEREPWTVLSDFAVDAMPIPIAGEAGSQILSQLLDTDPDTQKLWGIEKQHSETKEQVRAALGFRPFNTSGKVYRESFMRRFGLAPIHPTQDWLSEVTEGGIPPATGRSSTYPLD